MKKLILFSAIFILFANTALAKIDMSLFYQMVRTYEGKEVCENYEKIDGYPELHWTTVDDISATNEGWSIPFDSITYSADGSFSATWFDLDKRKYDLTGQAAGDSISFKLVKTYDEDSTIASMKITIHGKTEETYSGIKQGAYVNGTFEATGTIFSQVISGMLSNSVTSITYKGTFSFPSPEEGLDTFIDSAPPAAISVRDVYFRWYGVSGTNGIQGFYYQLDSGSKIFTGDTDVTLTNLTLGPHTFYVAAQDYSGNIDDTPAVSSFTVEAVKPADLPKDADRGEPKDKQASAGDPVNLTTGNMYVITSDLAIPGKGPGFDFTRAYNSQEERAGVLGYGWTHSYNLRLSQNPDTLQVKIKDEQNKGYLFNFNSGNNSYLSQRGEYSVLTKTSANYIWTKKDGLQYLFDLKGKLTQLKDRWGNTTNLTYNAQDQLTKITDASGRQVNLTYDSNGRITRLAAPLNRNFDYRYDSSDNLASVTDPAGNITSYAYDSQHNLTRKIDANAKAIDFTYDTGGRCTSSSGENNLGRTTLAFDPENSKTAITDSKGNVTTNYYNQDSLIIKVIDPQGNNTLSTWDNNLNLINRTDPLGRVTNMAYDASGNLIQVTDPAGNITKFTYEPTFNLVKAATDAQGNITTYTYDVKGNLTKVTDAAASNTLYSYNASGQATGAQNALGKSTYFTYDTQGNLTQTKDALGYITTFTYDALGNLLSSKDPRGNTTQFSYNNLSRLTQTAYADNSIVTYAYDALGNRTAVADALGQTTYYTYDQAGELKSTTDALGQSVWYDYDSEGNLICVTDQNNNKTTYTYDSLNRLATQTDARGNITQYSYDKAGNRTSMTDAKGQTTNYEYDSLNRLVSLRASAASEAISYTYDPLGRRLSITDSQGTTNYSYDKLDRLTSSLRAAAGGEAISFTYTYDALGNRLTMVDPDAKTTKYAYDALNRILTITDPQNKVTTYAYDPAGNQTSVTYPNGTKAAYTYDNLNRLTKLTNAKGTTKLSEYSYTYDAAGRRVTSLRGSGGSASEAISYSYDKLGQLIEEKGASYTTTYTYDPAGNRLTQKGQAPAVYTEHSYTYNSLNQLVSEEATTTPANKKIIVAGTVSDKSFIDYVKVNGITAQLGHDTFTCPNVVLTPGQNTITAVAADVAGNTTTKAVNVTYQPDVTVEQLTYSYDANGNLTSSLRGSTATEAIYSYDALNRLTSLRGAVGDEAIYKYDGDSRRISKTAAGVTTRYLYDGDEVALEKAGSITTNYTHGARIDEIISDSRGYYYHYDGLGSVTGLTNSSGAQLNSYAYEGFGNLSKQTGSVSNPWLFTGRQYDAESGLYYYRNRYYDPRIGRFITQDPAGMVDGPNLYSYVKNNPVNFVDPWGLCGLKDDQDNVGLIDMNWQIDAVIGGVTLGAKAIALGLSAGASSVLYSGSGQKALAAASTGIPIFKTAIGNVMNKFEIFTGMKLPQVIWDAASAIYAASARGTVQVFVNELNKQSTLYRIEVPIIEFLGKAEIVFK